MPKRALWVALAIAIGIEGAWEILENSPVIIDRYREMTMAYGYSGDSVLNSVSDATFMILGFLAASRMRWWQTVGIALAFELFTLWALRDNLTLHVLMLVAPVEAVKDWQGGCSSRRGDACNWAIEQNAANPIGRASGRESECQYV